MAVIAGLTASPGPLAAALASTLQLALLFAVPPVTLALLARSFRAQSKLELAQWQRDGLTGLLTRRAMTEKALTLQADSLGLIMLDIDHFKRINDQHLHAGGDRVLVHAARELETHLRLSDCVSRHGGEEFCVLLPGASLARTAELAERLVTQARSQRVRMPDGAEESYTLSAGIAHCAKLPLSEAMWAQLLQDADAALYAAKRGGRDRVGLYSPSPVLTRASTCRPPNSEPQKSMA